MSERKKTFHVPTTGKIYGFEFRDDDRPEIVKYLYMLGYHKSGENFKNDEYYYNSIDDKKMMTITTDNHIFGHQMLHILWIMLEEL